MLQIGRLFTMSAAISTAGIPPMARPSAARRSYFSLRMNLMLQTGIRNALDPIMIGNAAFGSMPSKLIMMRQGAYRADAECHQRARRKLIAMPSWSFSAGEAPAPSRRAPPGKCGHHHQSGCDKQCGAIPTWIFRRGPAGDDRCPKPRADDRRQDQEDQGPEVDLDNGDGLDKRLKNRRPRMADVEVQDVFVADDPRSR